MKIHNFSEECSKNVHYDLIKLDNKGIITVFVDTCNFLILAGCEVIQNKNKLIPT